MRTWLVITSVILIASCSSVPLRWHRANTSEAQRQTDIAACRSSARTEAEREDAISHRPSTDTAGNPSTYQSNMAAYEYRKNRDALFARCMTGKGYRQD